MEALSQYIVCIKSLAAARKQLKNESDMNRKCFGWTTEADIAADPWVNIRIAIKAAHLFSASTLDTLRGKENNWL